MESGGSVARSYSFEGYWFLTFFFSIVCFSEKWIHPVRIILAE